MNRSKIIPIMILSLITMIIVMITSFTLEARSQKLPAVVKAAKILISAQVSGVVEKISIGEMENVQINSDIVTLSNHEFSSELNSLMIEKAHYQALVASASNGDILNLELLEIDEEINERNQEIDELEAELQLINDKKDILDEIYQAGSLQNLTDKRLYGNGILSFKEYNESSEDFWKIREDFYELRSDSLLTEKNMINLNGIISNLSSRKTILSNNHRILAAKNMMQLTEVNQKISEIQLKIENLEIGSNNAGIISNINVDLGENVKQGDVIAEISDLNNVWVTAYGNSASTKKIRVGNKAILYSNSGEKISGRVRSVSPVMEKVKSLSSDFETVNTYSKIVIDFADLNAALEQITPGERLFVRINY